MSYKLLFVHLLIVTQLHRVYATSFEIEIDDKNMMPVVYGKFESQVDYQPFLIDTQGDFDLAFSTSCQYANEVRCSQSPSFA